MFYSQQLLLKKGALGTIWVAAHSHKKLSKEDVSNTNISSSVDKILLDEVPVVTYRILAYLLLGVVRIYSKKVEYLFRDCNNVLSEVRHFVTSKKCDADIEVMCAPYSSITMPERFELDAFDLEIIVNLNRDHIKMQEEITLEGKKVGTCSPSFHQSYMEEDTSHYGGFSAVHTTCNDNYSMSTMTAEMVAGATLRNSGNLDRSTEKFCSSRFSLEDCLPPMLFDEAEERADPGITFHEDSQTDGVEINPPNSPIMSGYGGRPGDNAEYLDKEHADSANTEFSKLMGLQNEKIQIISPKIPVSLSVSINATPESKVANSPGARTPGLMAVGTPATKEGARVSKKRKCIYDANEIVITNKVYKGGLDDVNEGARAFNKRKCLYDTDEIVIKNKVYKEWLNDRSALVKKRKKTALRNNANQMSEKIFSQPLVPGVSINFSLLRRIETSFASVDLKLSPIDDQVFHESFMTEVEETNLCEGDDKQEKWVRKAISWRLRVHILSGGLQLYLYFPLNKKKHELVDYDLWWAFIRLIIALVNLLVSVLIYLPLNADHWSSRTRSVAQFLHTEFLARKKRGENEVVKLSQAVEGKSKKRNARLFFELLALTTRGFLNVKQDNPYGDISIVETSKLKESLEGDNMA